MGMQTMNKQSENKVTITNTIDKSKQSSTASTKLVKDELNEQELDQASGGLGNAGSGFSIFKKTDMGSPV
jgi:hypothetical protein